MIIRTVAQDCKNHGKEYEDNLREREKGNPKYSFMWKNIVSLSNMRRFYHNSHTELKAPGYEYFRSLRSEAIKPTTEFDDNVRFAFE